MKKPLVLSALAAILPAFVVFTACAAPSYRPPLASVPSPGRFPEPPAEPAPEPPSGARTLVLAPEGPDVPAAARIQAALDAPPPRGLGGKPGTVHLDRGVWRLEAPLALRSGQRLIGVSPPSATWNRGQPRDGTILQYTGPTERFAIELDRDARWCEVRELFVVDGHPGPACARGALRLEATWHVTIERVEIEGFGSTGDPGPVRLAERGVGIHATGALFTRILDCRMRSCDVFVELVGHANHNLVQGGHFTLDRTNSGIVIDDSTSNLVLHASFEQATRGGGESFHAFFEFLGASHNCVIANRLEVGDDFRALGTTAWHYSLDARSTNNLILANQFTDLPHPPRVGAAVVRGVAGIATRRGRVCGTIVSSDGGLRYRFPLPADWVGTAPTLEIDVVGDGRPGEELRAYATLFATGDRYPTAKESGVEVVFPPIPSASGLVTTSATVEGLPPLRADHRWLEVRFDGSPLIEQVTMAFDATDTSLVRR